MLRPFKMGGPESPCKDCDYRREDCHSKCEIYGDFLKERQEYMKKRSEIVHEVDCDIQRAERIKADGGWSLKRNKG